MAQYKIVVFMKGYNIQRLYKRSWIFGRWELIRQEYHDKMPFSQRVASWQHDYKIPDKRVYFINKNIAQP